MNSRGSVVPADGFPIKELQPRTLWGVLVLMTSTKANVSYRIDRSDDHGNVLGHVAEIDDDSVAVRVYKAACERWPGQLIPLRQGKQVIADSRTPWHE
jgi:hypothetical protein